MAATLDVVLWAHLQFGPVVHHILFHWTAAGGNLETHSYFNSYSSGSPLVVASSVFGELNNLVCRPLVLRIFEDRIILSLDPKFFPTVKSSFHRAQDIVLPVVPEAALDSDPSLSLLDILRALKV
ncbi:hypothetical protein NDU88_011955 [Pleurodeles waltl]|uniref:Uncharacterized protein n=1 Tax=Pleurodeles waltl TaxID=8319 RepID=A0AAV7R392_PLEWA|nr:hypothetical protein NDU88_011955 [Pleurodeles waltl]